jgi:hypothetical protein
MVHLEERSGRGRGKGAEYGEVVRPRRRLFELSSSESESDIDEIQKPTRTRSVSDMTEVKESVSDVRTSGKTDSRPGRVSDITEVRESVSDLSKPSACGHCR